MWEGWYFIHSYYSWNKTCDIMVSWRHQRFVYDFFAIKWFLVPTHQIMCMALWGGTVTMACSKTHNAWCRAGTPIFVMTYCRHLKFMSIVKTWRYIVGSLFPFFWTTNCVLKKCETIVLLTIVIGTTIF